MIYKIVVLLLSVIFISPCFAVQNGYIEYDGVLIDYSLIDGPNLQKEADAFFKQYEVSADKKMLKTAMAKYYILTKIYTNNSYYPTQLARTYDESKLDRFAKEFFSKALNINRNDPYANYYFGEFYYKRAEYRKALRYYKHSISCGYQNYYDLNYKIATIYEKFADLETAKYYYNKAYSLNPSAVFLKDKILQIDSLDYGKSEYYNRNK